MWREGNAGGTPSRAECAGVPLSKMPPPLLNHIFPLPSYQTGRCLLTFCGCHTYAYKDLLRPSLSFCGSEDHYCCRQQPFYIYIQYHRLPSTFYCISPSLSLSFCLNSLRHCSHKCLSDYSGAFSDPVTPKVESRRFSLSFGVEMFAMRLILCCKTAAQFGENGLALNGVHSLQRSEL